MNDFTSIKLIEEKDRATITFCRPPLNVLNIAMMKEINRALETVKQNNMAKILLIRAEGKAFSAGVDISEHTADKVDEMMSVFHKLFVLLNSIPIPVVAVVEGAALGGGCEVALFCDMIVASDKAKFGQPEIKVGVFPPIAAGSLPKMIGANRTMEFLMSGDTISVLEAEEIGLVNKVFPVANFEVQLNEFIGKFTAQSKVILEMTKRAVRIGCVHPRLDAIHLATELYLLEMMQTEDAHIGLNAFMEKKTAVWVNR